MWRLSNQVFMRASCRFSRNYSINTSHTKHVASQRYEICRLFSNTSASSDCSKFTHKQPQSRLGKCHPSLSSFLTATGNNISNDAKEVETSTLIILTNIHERKLLLGKKLRGFGTGKYNGFGGRIERGETQARCAQRELMEEANLGVDLEHFEKGSVGTLSFTFQDRKDMEMLVHLFHVNVHFNNVPLNDERNFKGVIIDPDTIRPCDEMIPEWFDWWEIPLDKMFADDSIWLVYFLSSLDNVASARYNGSPPEFNGWFHFAPGGDGNNQILHHFLNT